MTTIQLHNPGNKLISILGAPIKTRKYIAKSVCSSYRCQECTFVLPAGWVLADEPSKYGGRIVAKEVGTERYVHVTTASAVPMSEVHN